MSQRNNNDMNRRSFLKKLGLGGAVSAAALYGCGGAEHIQYSPEGAETSEVPKGKMTYRSFPAIGEDKPSILGSTVNSQSG